MRLVHDAEDDAGVAAVLLRKLRPDALELSIGGATLRDDAAIPAGIVVLYIFQRKYIVRCESTYQVDDDHHVRSRVESSLDSLVVTGEETLVDRTADGRCHQLPSES